MPFMRHIADRMIRFPAFAGMPWKVAAWSFPVLLYACGESDEMLRLRQLAETGNASAQHNLALRLTRNEHGERDYAQAIEWYRKAAAQGVPESAFNLGTIFRTGAENIPGDEQQACHWFKQAAQAGLPNGMFELALCLGRTEAAAAWLKRASDAGVADATAELGVRILYGSGVKQNVGEGLALSRQAAEAGSSMGMHNYAVSLAEGIGGGKKDQRAAFEWFERAVKAGSCTSYDPLADYYLRGEVVPKDEKKALELIYQGAAQGDKAALKSLARIFAQGELGVTKDPAKAASVRAMTPSCGL
ncbi:hypothetical protein FACS1894158_17150 [Betaproteobacteria bacterium]|nr:hypothetical protein FACS1894158_17150 [Betaproteobacteria bacterium]